MKSEDLGSQSQVLVTGRHWLGVDGVRSIGGVLVEMIADARQEIIIVAYRLTVSVGDFINVLEQALGRGCYVRIIRDCSGQIVPAEETYINRILTQYQTLAVWDFKELPALERSSALHAKMVIVDRSVAVVGSANFSRNGMIENHEVAIRISGPEARSLGIACDKLIENGQREGVLVQRKSNGS